MKKNIKARSIVIIVTLLICAYGIIGVPKNKTELVQNFQNNIRLGLDLKGCSYLVLEIQVQDAVKADADQTMERLKEDLRKQNITYVSMDDTEPKSVADAANVEVVVKGIPATQSGAFRQIVNDRYSTYTYTAL